MTQPQITLIGAEGERRHWLMQFPTGWRREYRFDSRITRSGNVIVHGGAYGKEYRVYPDGRCTCGMDVMSCGHRAIAELHRRADADGQP